MDEFSLLGLLLFCLVAGCFIWVNCPVHGYKILNEDMTAMNGFRYDVGQRYDHEHQVSMCRSGFHFCRHLPYCVNYIGHLTEPTRVFKIEGYRDVIHDPANGLKSVTSSMEIVKELEPWEVGEIVAKGQYPDSAVYQFLQHWLFWKREDYAYAIWNRSSRVRQTHILEMAQFQKKDQYELFRKALASRKFANIQGPPTTEHSIKSTHQRWNECSQ